MEQEQLNGKLKFLNWGDFRIGDIKVFSNSVKISNGGIIQFNRSHEVQPNDKFTVATKDTEPKVLYIIKDNINGKKITIYANSYYTNKEGQQTKRHFYGLNIRAILKKLEFDFQCTAKIERFKENEYEGFKLTL